jgi:hypothetical protein
VREDGAPAIPSTMQDQVVRSFLSPSRPLASLMDTLSFRTDGLCKRVKTSGEPLRWGAIESYNLVHLVGSMSVKDDSEIVWRDVVSNPPWDLWSAHDVGRSWRRIKRSVKDHETLPFSGKKYRWFLHHVLDEPNAGQRNHENIAG